MQLTKMSKLYKQERKQSNKSETTRHYMLPSQTPQKAKTTGKTLSEQTKRGNENQNKRNTIQAARDFRLV